MGDPLVIQPMPLSRSQLGKLGTRMALDAKRPGDDDLFAAAMEAYDNRRSIFQSVVSAAPWGEVALKRDVPLTVTGRTKSIDTLLDKLRRTPAQKLGSIRDVAGVRIVAPINLHEQSRVATAVKAIFVTMDRVLRDEPLPTGAEVAALVERSRSLSSIDRRLDPRAGYRAIHVVDTVVDVPVEVQIRTELQGLWADLYERFSDQAGRDLRYMSDDEMREHATTQGDPDQDRCAAALKLHDISLREINEVEAVETALADHESGQTTPLAAAPDDVVAGLRRIMTENRRRLRESLGDIAGTIEALLGKVPEHEGVEVSSGDQLPD